jgi:hypothetical protein
VVSPVILSLNALCLVIVTGITTRRGEEGKEEILQEEGRRCPRVSGMGLRYGDMSSTDSSFSDEDAANIAVNKGLLFPNVGHKCLMAKDGERKNVKSRASTKYTTSSDEGSSSEDEDNLLTLFANLNMHQKEKLNELISVIHKKDELLDSQEEFLIKENKKHVKVKNAYAQEVEKNENLTKELSNCHDTISNLRTENTNLFAKVEKLNACDDSITNLKNNNAILHVKIDELNACKSCHYLY